MDISESFLSRLSAAGLLPTSDSSQLSKEIKEKKQALIAGLLQHTNLTTRILAEHLADHLQLNFFDLHQCPNNLIKDIVDSYFIQTNRILPLFVKKSKLYIAISDPLQLDCLSDIKFYTDLNIQPLVVEWDKLNHLIDQLHNNFQYTSTLLNTKNLPEHDTQIIQLVNDILQNACHKNASDIHIEPYKIAYRIRLRIDGLLHIETQFSLEIGQRICARLKVMAHLDMAERRFPQDGRFNFQHKSQADRDCRISVCPTLFGEKIVIRILTSANLFLNLDNLGMLPEQIQIF